MKPLLVTSGEPAGIGPDICLALAGSDIPLVVCGDRRLLEARARQLGKPICFVEYKPEVPYHSRLNHLTILSNTCQEEVTAGKLDASNSPYVISMLTDAVRRCLSGEFSGVVTAPVNKAIINQAGFDFTGHTEFFATLCHTKHVVMMLASKEMKVALVTTHVPVRAIAELINKELLSLVITKVQKGMQEYFGIMHPKIYVAGLNPHAGESGYLGREEIDVIAPVLETLMQKGINVQGPFPADTLFAPQYLKEADVFVAMYHDQGLPVLKYSSFGQAVNVTLGLPIIRTSVDHGTALELAGTGRADPASLIKAVEMAAYMVDMKR